MFQLSGCDLVGFILQLIIIHFPKVIQYKGGIFVQMP